MKKDSIKIEFLELRAKGYTYKEICEKLDITKPTAIKWGKEFAGEIERQRKYITANLFAEKIIESEQGIMIMLEQLRRTGKKEFKKPLEQRIEKKALPRLEKIFAKEIAAIHLIANEEYVTNAIFIFNEDVQVNISIE